MGDNFSREQMREEKNEFIKTQPFIEGENINFQQRDVMLQIQSVDT